MGENNVIVFFCVIVGFVISADFLIVVMFYDSAVALAVYLTKTQSGIRLN